MDQRLMYFSLFLLLVTMVAAYREEWEAHKV